MIGSTVQHVATGRIGEVVKQNSRKHSDGRLVVKWTTAVASDVEGQRLVTSGEQTQHNIGRSDVQLVGNPPVESDADDDTAPVTPAPAPRKTAKKR